MAASPVADWAGNLGFSAPYLSDAIGPSRRRRRLDEDERNTVTINDGIRGNPNVTVISESGVYRLIFTSRRAAERSPSIARSKHGNA